MRPLLLVVLAAPLLAQDPAAVPQRPVIRTTGEATVQVQPDLARVDVGVISEAATADKAAADAAARADAVVRAVRSAMGAGGEVRTISISVQPVYSYPGGPRPSGKPTITGYTARNIIEVTTPNLNRVGTLIDAAMKAGANSVQRLEFTLQRPREAQEQALREAAKDARASADAIASALGLRIVRIVAVDQASEEPIRPLMAMARTEIATTPPTPVETGAIEVRARVSLTAEIAQ